MPPRSKPSSGPSPTSSAPMLPRSRAASPSSSATTSITYGEFDRWMDGVAGRLQALGATAIAVCAGTSIAYAATFLGALRAGVVVAPIAPSSTPGADRRDDPRQRRAGLFHRRSGRREHGRRNHRHADRTARRQGGVSRLDRRCCLHPARDRAGHAVQHHLFERHDRYAEGHRPTATRCAGATSRRGRSSTMARGR